ncbi:hypothetical protein BD626DRAFT_512729 [Schizophyllum amplum]|uniref:Uncharacterized protein n=1 Tax=Schizophyllum amplum TaxID=97359 RepID=A0A550BZW2_9AGAR|nr:hypothetical protein BD626DRAFT_512729 [Auriculariopsis ampla]
MFSKRLFLFVITAGMAATTASAHAVFERQGGDSSASYSSSAFGTASESSPGSGTTVVTSVLSAARVVQTLINKDPFIVDVTEDVIWTITTTLAPEVTTEVATSVAT